MQIIVAAHCFGCDEARSIAAFLEERLPWLDVRVIELDGSRPVPPRVVATPTYLLDGRVISLGNPNPEELARDMLRRNSASTADKEG